MAPYRILFVCWGNICRSPTAEAILRQRIDDAGLQGQIEVDSAGTSAEHSGDPPDSRAVAEAARRGVDMRRLRSRKVRPDDWDRFDLILVADEVVEQALLRQAPPGASIDKVARFTAFGDGAQRTADDLPAEVPDPWYGNDRGFVEVFDLLDTASEGILAYALHEVTARD